MLSPCFPAERGFLATSDPFAPRTRQGAGMACALPMAAFARNRRIIASRSTRTRSPSPSRSRPRFRSPESGDRGPAASTRPSESGHGLRLGLGHRLRCPACASIPFSCLYGWTLVHGVIPRERVRRYTRHESHPARVRIRDRVRGRVRDRVRDRVRIRPGPASGIRGPGSGVRGPAAPTRPSESGHGLGLGHGLRLGLRLGLGHRLRCPACASIPFSCLYGWPSRPWGNPPKKGPPVHPSRLPSSPYPCPCP